MSSVFRQKIPSPNTLRTLILEAKRFNALAALDEGLVDGLGGVSEVLKFVGEMQLIEKARSGVYGRLKGEMWRETVGYLDDHAGSEKVAEAQLEERKRQVESEEKRVVDWEKSKL